MLASGRLSVVDEERSVLGSCMNGSGAQQCGSERPLGGCLRVCVFVRGALAS